MDALPDNLILKEYLASGDLRFFEELAIRTHSALHFGEILQLSILRKRAAARGLVDPSVRFRRVAMIGGANLRPLVDLVEHFAAVLGGVQCEMWVGEYDNYHAEALDPQSALFEFKPEIVLVLPSERRCVYSGALIASREEQQSEGLRIVRDLLDLCASIHSGSEAEVIVGNFRLPPFFDPGPLRATHFLSDYTFRKFVNTELGYQLPSYVHLCDIEFLSNRRGNLKAHDDRGWFESKQPFAADLIVDVAREYAHVVSALGTASKKVAVLDLDNTLWGGVIGDDGLEGIELGTTSPRGEAFREFQQYLLQLSRRGILLAVCSKNDHDKAVEPFLKHPEMVLRADNIICFRANWEPKSDNLRTIAQELNLGLDSMVFLDDNPAEIDIVRQFVPEVTTVLLGQDPSQFVAKIKELRLFEVRSLTGEDLERPHQYKQNSERQQLLDRATDMGAYLSSLQMTATITSFNTMDAPRITQLIAKSNQFNLTTKRRTEAAVLALIDEPNHEAFTVRLTDRFGDLGVISIVIGEVTPSAFVLDTWLMSCRVLKRQVEQLVLNEIVRLARERGCAIVVGSYVPTVKNGMVRDHYPKMGFTLVEEADSISTYMLTVATFRPEPTHIQINRESHASAGNSRQAANHF